MKSYCFLSFVVLLCVSLECFSGTFFDIWTIDSKIVISEDVRTTLELHHPDLSLFILSQGFDDLHSSIVYRGLPIVITLGHLNPKGLSDLLYNPISSIALRHQGRNTFMGPSISSGNNFIAVMFSLPFFEFYTMLSDQGQFHSFGGIFTIGEPHGFLRILIDLEKWHGEGSEDLVNPFWIPSELDVFNSAIMMDIPGIIKGDFNFVENLLLMVGVQVSLPVSIQFSEPYFLHSLQWWIKGNYHIGGSFNINNTSPGVNSLSYNLPDSDLDNSDRAGRILTWDVEIQFAWLSGGYMRDNGINSSIINERQTVKLRGELGIRGIAKTIFLFSDWLDNIGTIAIGFESDLPSIDIKLNFDHHLGTGSFYSDFSFSLKGLFQPELSLNILWHERNPYFVDSNIGFGIATSHFLFEINNWYKTDLSPDFLNLQLQFLPSVFDIHIGMEFKIDISAWFLDYKVQIEFEFSSPEDFSLDKLLFSTKWAPFFEEWETSLEFSVRG